jgi:hypothetical protein
MTTTKRTNPETGVRLNPAGLPSGMGSIHRRGAKYWAIYRGADGKIVQVNTGTDNEPEARLFLMRRALMVADERVEVLRRLISDEIRRRKGIPANGNVPGHGRGGPADTGDVKRRADGARKAGR